MRLNTLIGETFASPKTRKLSRKRPKFAKFANVSLVKVSPIKVLKIIPRQI